MVLRLWYGKLKLSKPYLGLATQSGRRSLWFTSHRHSFTNNGHKNIITTQNHPIVGQYKKICSSRVNPRNAIIEICGSVDDARKVFDEMPQKKNSDTWCVMMKCFVNNGYGKEALGLFTRFKREGNNNKPDGEMFKELFSAFTLTGDVNEGLRHFEAMQRDYGVIPSMEHYLSVTKMLAKSGHLEEALNFVWKMPMEPSVGFWETLMNLSRVHGDLELGDRCTEIIEKLDATRLDKVSSTGLVKEEKPDYRSKPEETNFEDTIVYETLKSLKSQMIEMGYVPNLSLHHTKSWKKPSKEEQVFYYREPLAFVN